MTGLIELAANAFATLVKTKTADEIRDELGIDDDLTEEEKAEIRKDNDLIIQNLDNQRLLIHHLAAAAQGLNDI